MKYLRPDQERDRTFFIDKASGVELETVEQQVFIDWLVDTDESNQPHYKQFGTTLEIVTDRSQEGAQFVKGFGGIGGNTQIYQIINTMLDFHLEVVISQ